MKKRSLVSPLLPVGVLLILLPIFTFMTLDRLERQKEFFTQQLLEKGTALIRTFEAGTRTGMFTMRWGAPRIQAMVFETALQPEVVYMMIVSREGKILAHSDMDQVGQDMGDMPRPEDLSPDPGRILYRIKPSDEEGEVFEVYKRFVPVRREGMHRGRMRAMQMMHDEDLPRENPEGQESRDWSRPYLENQRNDLPDPAEHYIFAGLSMKKERLAKERFLKETLFRGLFWFILGCAGMIALLAFQAYRAARASLTQVKAFSDQVIQNMPSGLVTMDRENRITSMNQAARDILGPDLTRPFPEMTDLIREMESSQKQVNKDMNLEIAPGRRVFLDVTASPVRAFENEITGYVFLFRDLTQISELKKQVETNRRLAAIGKLAAGVAHEIRNPLSSIKGFATYFGKRFEKNEDDRETALIMVKEVERINRSITQLLEFAKPLAVEKKDVDLREMIDHSLKLIHHDLEQKGIKTEVAVDTARTLIHTDGDRMNQILLNLYINAVAALEKGGTLAVSVKDTDRKDGVEIRVRDNGTGIDEAFLDQIFDPYVTGRPTGTGLGLSIVHRIIENLGGNIRVESKKGRGTCFIINLPVS
ncbi:MAG: ATP-binding protein [Desulfobacteraceae bacterium]|nr:ATP-binding protein [Desulfobacteraceae bacterium]